MTKARLLTIGILVIALFTIGISASVAPVVPGSGERMTERESELWHARMQNACHIDLSEVRFAEGQPWFESTACPGMVIVLWEDGIG